MVKHLPLGHMAKTSAIKVNMKAENKSKLAIPPATVAKTSATIVLNSGLTSTTNHMAITSAIKTT